MRFGVFADLHYDVIPDADDRIKELVQRFSKLNLDFIIELGDFCLSTTNSDILNEIRKVDIPIFFLIGNHNTDFQPLDDVVRYLGLDNSYYSFIRDGIKFIILNPNYIKENNKYIPFAYKNYYRTNGEYPYLPPNQIDWLIEELQQDYPCIVCTHQSLTNDFGHNGIVNRMEIRSILEKFRKKILFCLNGHDHGSMVTSINGVVYYGINSCAYFWQELKDNFGFDLCIHEKYPMLKNMVLYKNALFSIVEIDDNYNFSITGIESEYLENSPWETDMPSIIEGVSIAPRTITLYKDKDKTTIF